MADDKPSRFSSTFLSGLAQASAFMAAPLLTAAIGIGVRYGFGFAAELAAGSAVAAAVPILFVAGALFAAGAIIANYKANKQRKFEQSSEVEHCIEKAFAEHQPDLSMGQGVAPVHKKNWCGYVNDRRAAASSEVVRN